MTGGYRQSATTSNTNAHMPFDQASALIYEWSATYTSGTSAGLYLFASTATGAERGNSYRIWQDATSVKIYENASDVATLRASFAAANAAGQTHSYQAIYDPLTGKLQVWRDNVALGSWTDATPLTSGSHLSLRTDGSNVLFDDSDHLKAQRAGVSFFVWGTVRACTPGLSSSCRCLSARSAVRAPLCTSIR